MVAKTAIVTAATRVGSKAASWEASMVATSVDNSAGDSVAMKTVDWVVLMVAMTAAASAWK